MPRRIYDPNHASFSHALTALRTELEAIPHEQLETVRLDIGDAIITALGVGPNVQRYRDKVATELGESATIHIDRLETAAQACGRAHALYLTTLHGTDVAEMIAELSRTRRVLLLEAEGLVSLGKLPGSVLGELVGGTGYRAMCMDVLQLVSALRAEWDIVKDHTPVTPLELDQAEAIANAVANILGENEQATASSEYAELRQRAYTFLLRTYDEVRRSVTYVRWFEGGDGDAFAPSLFSGRTRRRNDDDTDDVIVPVGDPIVPIVTAPVVNGPTNGSPTNGAPISPGMPGAPPFGPS